MPEYLSHEEIDRRIDEQEREQDQIIQAQEALMHRQQASQSKPSLWRRLKTWLMLSHKKTLENKENLRKSFKTFSSF